jgi:hypothetical protein
MPINRLLKDKRTSEEIELLNKAFNHALNLLGVVDRHDPLCDMVARKVIEVGATGISRPRRTRKALIGDSIFLAKGNLDCRLSGSGALKACDFIFKIPSNRRA